MKHIKNGRDGIKGGNMKTNTLLWRVFIFTLAFLLAKTFNTGWWMLLGIFAFLEEK